ncbi:MAG: PIN domain-containing protein [archaeon]
MSEEAYFFDTYAFFEIIRGNPAYEKYKNAGAITTIFNLAELNYGLKKEASKEKADSITEKYSTLLVDVKISELKKAMDLKITNRKISIPDAIGYTIAKSHSVKFLTGDKEFEKMPNVEFVKK